MSELNESDGTADSSIDADGNVNDLNGSQSGEEAEFRIIERDARGRIVKSEGKPVGARGNPIAVRMKKMRSAVLKAHTPQEAAEAVKSLLTMAQDPKISSRDRIAAYRVWLDYVVGKPADMDKLREGGDGSRYTFIFMDQADAAAARRAVDNIAGK